MCAGVKDSNNAWTGSGHKKIAQLEKAIHEKDKQINVMKKQREQVDQHKGKLESDIQQLRTQISALKVRISLFFKYALIDDRKQKATCKNHKKMHHRKVHEL